jgi:hypothetical protein
VLPLEPLDRLLALPELLLLAVELQLELLPMALLELLLFMALLLDERCDDVEFPGMQLVVFEAPLGPAESPRVPPLRFMPLAD